MTKRLALIGTAVMTTLLALVAVWQFRIVVLYVLISLVLAATFRSISKSESRRNLVTRFRLIFQYVAGLGISSFLIFLVGRFLIGDFQQLTEKLSVQNAWMLPTWLQGLEGWLPAPNQLFNAITSEPELVLSAVLGFTEGISGLVGGLFVILFLSIYWSINQNHFERLWLSLLPAEQRKHARDIWRNVEKDIGDYTRSELIQSLLAVVLLGLGYWLLGSPYPAFLAVTGAVAWMIPVVGGAMALLLPLVSGLLISAELSLSTVLYTLIVLIALEILVEPRLFKRTLDNPVLTFVILLAMADAFGLLGIIAAPPISVVCQVLWKLLVTDRAAEGPAIPVSDLKERQARLQDAIDQMDEIPPPLVLSSMERLAGLLEKAEPVLQAAIPAEQLNAFHPSQPVTPEDASKLIKP
jgi:predicted PurR-regulated permease PerM